MRRLSFLSRVAFICNLCLAVVWLMRFFPALPYDAFVSTLIIAGLVLSFIFNGLVNLLYAWLLLRRKPLADHVPVWLAAVNFLFLIFQVYLLI
jgi:uncharacterized membrane protein YozB (DUF420 family)